MNIQPVEGGVVLDIRAAPGSRSNEIRGQHDGRLRVAVTAAPEKGKANKAICKLVAQTLGLRKSQVTLYSGVASPQKRLLIADIDVEGLTTLIANVISRT